MSGGIQIYTNDGECVALAQELARLSPTLANMMEDATEERESQISVPYSADAMRVAAEYLAFRDERCAEDALAEQQRVPLHNVIEGTQKRDFVVPPEHAIEMLSLAEYLNI